MTTANIGVGHLGGALAQHLVRGNEPVVLAAQDQSHAPQVATALGPLATAAPVREAISQADTVVLAVWSRGRNSGAPHFRGGFRPGTSRWSRGG